MKRLPPSSLVSLEAATDLIRRGEFLAIAGPEALLDQLPRGHWVGGTCSYFADVDVTQRASDRVFITHLPDEGEIHFATYATGSVRRIVHEAPENGYSFAIVPAGSSALHRFAAESRFWPDIYLKPVVGWVAGIDLAGVGQQTPKVYNGSDGSKHENSFVVAQVSLPSARTVSVEMVNIFRRDPRATIRFSTTGFAADACEVNGRPAQLAAFLAEHGNADGKLPLVGDFGDASINVSIQSIDAASGRVTFYAPVFPEVDYYLAEPVGDYLSRFASEIERYKDEPVVFSCNCILNYLHGGFEGKQTVSLQGPVTFGEIAYLLHNQTMIVLKIA